MGTAVSKEAVKREKERKSYYIPPKLLKEFNHLLVDLDIKFESEGVQRAIEEFCKNHQAKGGK